MSESNLGVALTRCFYCGGDGVIILNTRLTPRDAANVESMNGMVIDMEPCQKCEGYMKLGVILITIDDAKSDPGWDQPPSMDHGNSFYTKPSKRRGFIPNPYRTGGFFVLKDEAIRKAIDTPELADWAIKHRWMFIQHAAAEKMGLFNAATKKEVEQ